MRVCLVGDVHGSKEAVLKANMFAKHRGADLCIGLGDFGYTYSEDFLALFEGLATPWWFLRGNHDDTNRLRDLAGTHHLHGTEPIEVAPNLSYLPDWSVVDIGDARCLVLGGAVSVDRIHRRENVSWWRDETLSHVPGWECPDDIQVVLAHDSPDYEGLEQAVTGHYGFWHKGDDESAAHRSAMNRIREQIRPAEWYHGHYHVETRANRATTQIFGLAASSHSDVHESCLIVEFGTADQGVTGGDDS